jgi:hypothetical protein
MMLQLRTAITVAAFGLAAMPWAGTAPIGTAAAHETVTVAVTGATPPNFTPAEVAPVCSTAQQTFVFYVSPSDKTYRYDASMISRLRTYTRQLTGFIRSEGLASSANTKGPLLKVACNTDGSIRVGGLRSTTTSAVDSFGTIKQDLANAGFANSNTKYLVFYDDPTAGKCGEGDFRNDDRKITTNANNVGPKYAVVYGNTSTSTCWTWYYALHELFHTMGAVQAGAPKSSGASHCNDGLDIMCYDDDGPTSQYTETRCTKTKLDCGYDTYFDTATESGEWLATHWNLGWSGNSYLAF